MFDSSGKYKGKNLANNSNLNNSPLTTINNNNKNNKDNCSSSNTSSSFHEMQRNDSLSNGKVLGNSSEMRVKVNIESSNGQSNSSTVVYKYISITDKHRTKDVKRLILEKFFLNPDLCEKYTLVQILIPNHNHNSNSNNDHLVSAQNELIINDNCNVFYAAKTMSDMQFLLKSKSSPIYQNGNLNSSHNNLNGNHKNEAPNSSPLLNRQNRSSLRANSQMNLNRYASNEASSKSKNRYFDELPPQSPSRYQKNTSGQHNPNSKNQTSSSSSWLKKILS
jgi:hypothetical protein